MSRIVALAGAVIVFASLVIAVRQAGAIPVFARRYGASCERCHAPFPKLTAAGEGFAAHGFRRRAGETPPDTIGTSDPLLVLGAEFPLAIRFDMNVQLVNDDEDGSRTDFQAPWVLKVLSSAPLSKSLSYYFYFLMSEHGEVEGVEDAYVHWDDVGGRPFDLVVGQFQVSDPLFKRELRLPFEDYAIYGARIGALATNLTYDRGLMAALTHGRASFVGEIVNGNGKEAPEGRATLDDDAPKNVAARVSLDAVPERFRIGGFAYSGRQDGESAGGDRVRAEVWYAGLDATWRGGPWELNAQWLHRADRRPTFTPGEPDAATDGGFVEALWIPEDARWYGYGLWNRVDCDHALLAGGEEGDAASSRLQSFAAGAGYLVQRNVRLQGEAAWDTEAERFRATLTLSAAY